MLKQILMKRCISAHINIKFFSSFSHELPSCFESFQKFINSPTLRLGYFCYRDKQNHVLLVRYVNFPSKNESDFVLHLAKI